MARTTLDSCDVTTGWSVTGTNSLTQNTTTKFEGSAAINIIKSDTSSANIFLAKTFASTDMTNRTLAFKLYVKDSATLTILNNTFDIWFNESGVWERAKALTISSWLSVGWNTILFRPGTDDAFVRYGYSYTVGTVDMSTANTVFIRFYCANTSDTFAAGDLILDILDIGFPDDVSGVSFETEDSVNGVSVDDVSKMNGSF